MYSFSVWGADKRVSSNLVSLRNIGKVCSEVVSLVNIGNVNSLVRLNSVKVLNVCSVPM